MNAGGHGSDIATHLKSQDLPYEMEGDKLLVPSDPRNLAYLEAFVRRDLQPFEGKRWFVGVAAMAAVDAIDRRSTISLQPEQRADAIHRPSIATPRR